MIKKWISLVMTFALVFTLLAVPGFALPQDPVMYAVDSAVYGDNQETLIVEGYFINTSMRTVTAISDVVLEISSNGNVIASGRFDVSKTRTVSLGIGDAEHWQFIMEKPLKGSSLAALKADARITYNGSNPEQSIAGKKVYYNGRKIDFDVQPAVINGRLLIPARAVFEKMGCAVVWNGESKSLDVTRSGSHVIIYVNDPIMLVDGKPIKLDVPATIIDSRTLVPLRAISNALGAGVIYGEVNEMAVVYE